MIVLADPEGLPVNVKSTPRFDRRLEDKLLIAFTQAYEIGERDVARRLLAMLREFEHRPGRDGERHEGAEASARAELWSAFVDARERYLALSGDSARAKTRAPATAERMQAEDALKDAYRNWSAFG